LSFDQKLAFESDSGLIVSGAAGFFSGSGTPLGSAAPVGSTYRDTASGYDWLKVGAGNNDWFRFPYNLEASSQVPAYDANGNVSTVTMYKSGSQVTANRLALITLSYDANQNVSTEVWQIFNENDGTTVLKTITFTNTYDANENWINTAVTAT
jgi:hypothetical protein